MKSVSSLFMIVSLLLILIQYGALPATAAKSEDHLRFTVRTRARRSNPLKFKSVTNKAMITYRQATAEEREHFRRLGINCTGKSGGKGKSGKQGGNRDRRRHQIRRRATSCVCEGNVCWEYGDQYDDAVCCFPPNQEYEEDDDDDDGSAETAASGGMMMMMTAAVPGLRHPVMMTMMMTVQKLHHLAVMVVVMMMMMAAVPGLRHLVMMMTTMGGLLFQRNPLMAMQTMLGLEMTTTMAAVSLLIRWLRLITKSRKKKQRMPAMTMMTAKALSFQFPHHRLIARKK